MPEWPKPLSMTMMMMMMLMMNNMYLRSRTSNRSGPKIEGTCTGRWVKRLQSKKIALEGWEVKEGMKSCSSFAALAAVIFHISPAIWPSFPHISFSLPLSLYSLHSLLQLSELVSRFFIALASTWASALALALSLLPASPMAAIFSWRGHKNFYLFGIGNDVSTDRWTV